MPSLFISYRRTDSPDTVKLIHERLKRRLPRWEIFYDHESIPLGEQFPERLRAKVASATVVLVVIGPKWLEILQERKSAAIDHVGAEVRLALEATPSVVPILVGHAAMPTDADFADFADLQPLLQRNGRPVRPDPDFAVSLRYGWDGRDAGALRARLEGYAAVGVEHVLVEPAERELADWLAAVERIAQAGAGMLS